ncbi:MAG TPA: YbhB/YbcL family Raf kinase inhibitor-like protein [Stellaceae bacterium]|jgi:Raf kinase inhibitor-like YbhB/YbcL family protein|nr:YbhB/YbcL family Raf kinase inhibitor-like protein [Stellaceae bacterium]
MEKLRIAAFATLAAGLSLALASPPAVAAHSLKVSVDGFKNGGKIPTKYAFCVATAQGHTTGGENISPRISWSKGPSGTKSYAIILYDTDSPAAERDKMNKEGMTLVSTVPRQKFFHWVLADIPPTVTSLPEGAESNARVLHGKPATPSKYGMRGLNDFTKITASNDAMKGKYFGYDGPCPPWNDENVHHYHFTVYALSVKTLDLPPDFDAPAALAAMQGKVLAEGQELGLYTQNPAKGAVVQK